MSNRYRVLLACSFLIFVSGCSLQQLKNKSEDDKPNLPTQKEQTDTHDTAPEKEEPAESEKDPRPEETAVLLEQGIALLKEKKLEEAQQVFAKVLELDPENSDALRSIEVIKKVLDEQAPKADPEYSQTLNRRGLELMDEGRFEEAIQLFSKAIKLDPENAAAVRNRKEAMVETQKTDISPDTKMEVPAEKEKPSGTVTVRDTDDPTTKEVIFTDPKPETRPAPATKKSPEPQQKQAEPAKEITETTIVATDTGQTGTGKSHAAEEQAGTKTETGCQIVATTNTIPAEFYTGVKLLTDVPRVFQVGEVFSVKGRVTTGENPDEAIAFFSETDEDNSDMRVFYGNVAGDIFAIPVFFPQPGEYIFSVFPGEEGLSKAIEIEVVDLACDPVFNVTAKLGPQNLTASVRNGNALFTWEDEENNMFRLDFEQQNLKVRLYVMNAFELTPPNWVFEHFKPGEITVSVSGATTEGSSLHRGTDWKSGGKIMVQIANHFSRSNNKLDTISIMESYTPNEPIRIIGSSDEEIHPEMVVIDPDEQFIISELELNNGSFSSNFVPEKNGQYIFEINRDDHLSLFVAAVLPEGQIPLLPDYFDLQQNQKKPQEESMENLAGKMLVYVNQERKKRNLGALKNNEKLEELAQFRADDMCSRDYFGHVAPDGKDVGDYIKQYDIEWSVGENLVESDTVRYGHESLMHSPAHRELVIDPDAKYIGFGFCRTESTKSIKTVQIYGIP